MTALPDSSCVIYQWLSDAGYFMHALWPSATRIEAHVHDGVGGVLDRVPPATRVFAFHLNCTLTSRFPQQRSALIAALEARSIRVLNGGATDISKRSVQRTCARLGLNTVAALQHGDPDEVVIVKTDLNFGGDSEWALSEEERRALGIGNGSDIIWKPNHYRVLPRKDVEAAWWTDDRLVFERFVRNSRERWYRAFFFLDRVALCELESPNTIKKVGDSIVSRVWTAADEGVASLIHDLKRFAVDMRLDVGTVDAVADDAGRHYIIDINTTPAYNHPILGVVDHMRRTSC